MALNVAVPLSDLGGLSPTSPINIDCWDSIKMLVSPIGSESSGVSSLDSEEAKQVKQPSPRKPESAMKRDIRIYYNGRNVLDLYKNLETNSMSWKFRYSYLPQRNNISMFWANRSVYNRLGPNGLTPVYTINKCECCDFQYTSDCPESSYLSETSLHLSTTTTSPMIFTTALNKNQYYQTTKVTPAKSAANPTPTVCQQSFLNHKSELQMSCKQLYNQNNVTKTNFNDIATKRDNLTNTNSNYNNINKYNNLVGTTKIDVSQLASNLVSANLSVSPSNTQPTNMMMGFSKNSSHQSSSNPMDLMINSSNSYAAQNYFNTLVTSKSVTPITTSQSLHNSNISSNNGIPFNHSNFTNKTQICSSNNLYSLFNSSKTNNSAVHTLNASSNSNTYFNSFSSMPNSGTNINVNPITANSQPCGRVYRYF